MLDVLRVVEDPDLGLSIVELGLVYDVRLDAAGKVEVDMTLTTPACPYGPQLLQEVQYVLKSTRGVSEVKVNIVWDPPWSTELISEDAKLELGIGY